MQDYFIVGQIINTHGVRGEVKIIPLTDNPERFNSLKWVYVDKDSLLEKFHIEGVKFFKSFAILKFKEINDIDSAKQLKGIYLKVDRKNAIKLDPGSYFISDIVDCAVYNEKGILLGRIKDIIRTGSNDVYVVEGEQNGEILIPALKSVVKNISVENKKIVVELPEGLVDDEI